MVFSPSAQSKLSIWRLSKKLIHKNIQLSFSLVSSPTGIGLGQIGFPKLLDDECFTMTRICGFLLINHMDVICNPIPTKPQKSVCKYTVYIYTYIYTCVLYKYHIVAGVYVYRYMYIYIYIYLYIYIYMSLCPFISPMIVGYSPQVCWLKP